MKNTQHTVPNQYRYLGWFCEKNLPLKKGSCFQFQSYFLQDVKTIFEDWILEWFHSVSNTSQYKKENIRYLLFDSSHLEQTLKILKKDFSKLKQKTYNANQELEQCLKQTQLYLRNMIKKNYISEEEKHWEDFSEIRKKQYNKKNKNKIQFYDSQVLHKLKMVISPILKNMESDSLEDKRRNLKKIVEEESTRLPEKKIHFQAISDQISDVHSLFLFSSSFGFNQDSLELGHNSNSLFIEESQNGLL